MYNKILYLTFLIRVNRNFVILLNMHIYLDVYNNYRSKYNFILINKERNGSILTIQLPLSKRKK